MGQIKFIAAKVNGAEKYILIVNILQTLETSQWQSALSSQVTVRSTVHNTVYILTAGEVQTWQIS